MINKNLINYILSNSGKLHENETWYDVGKKFYIQAPNKKRAKKDKKYKKDSIARKAQSVWQAYLNNKNDLKLDKEIYVDGKLKFETFKKKPENIEMDFSDFDLEKVTTNPYGGMWLKYKKSESLYDPVHLEELKELLSKTITPRKKKDLSEVNDKSLIIYGSDKHIGALTKDNSVYTNKYDKSEIKRRLIDTTLEEIERWKALLGSFRSLYIMDLGDALDGFNGKTTGGLRGTSSHDLPQQMNNREQHDFYVEVHKELFDRIVEEDYAEDIYFIATSNSNHGGDFEYGAMKNLETYLNVAYPFVKTYISHTPVNHFTFGKQCIIFGHGKDDEDMKRGFPLIINDKVEKYIAEYIRLNKLEDYNITFVTGDLHQSAKTHGSNFRYKKVLSQYGSSKWMHSNFGSGQAGLSSEVFDNETNRVFETDYFFKINNLCNTGISFMS